MAFSDLLPQPDDENTALLPPPDTYRPQPGATLLSNPNDVAGVFGPGSSGYQEPLQGFGDRLAMALQGLAAPPTQYRGQGPGAAGFLTGLLHGGATAFSEGRIPAISAREKMNQELGQFQHEKNAQALKASGSEIVTGPTAEAFHLPLSTVGKPISSLSPEQQAGTKVEKPPASDTIGLTHIESLPYDAKTGKGLTASDLGKSVTDPDVQKRIGGMAAEKPATGFSQFMKETDVPTLGQMVLDGRLDPRAINITARGPGAAVATWLGKQGYNLYKFQLESQAMHALTQNTNTGVMANLQRAGNAVESAVGNMEALNKQFTDVVRKEVIPRGLVSGMNKVSLTAALNGAYGPHAQQIAQQFDTQVLTLRTEYPQVLNGGNAAQESQIRDAKTMLDSAYGEGRMQATLDIIRKNVGYKTASIRNLGAMLPGMQGNIQFPGMPAQQLPFSNAPPTPIAPAPVSEPKVRARLRANPNIVLDVPMSFLGKHPNWEQVTPVKAHTRAIR